MNQSDTGTEGVGDSPLDWGIDTEVDDIQLVEVNASCGVQNKLFNITGVTGTSYIRVQTGSSYYGRWVVNDKHEIDYNQEVLPIRYIGEPRAIFISPITPINNYIPIVSEPIQVETDQGLLYYPDSFMFRAKTQIDDEYKVSYNLKEYDTDTLEDAYTQYDIKYLQIPFEVQTQIVNMTKEITAGIDSDYYKIKAIEDYLKENYVYNLEYTPAPEEVDPVLWFLFESREGICMHYNSALVLMARSIGVPMRLVIGFHVNPVRHSQTVRPEQAHAWAEAYFRNIGWIRFDATGTAQELSGYTRFGSVQTVTRITHQDNICYKEDNFTVSGYVTDFFGDPVNGLTTLFYLKQNKTLDGALCGKTVSVNNTFRAECAIPQNLAPGIYYLEAITLGNSVYNWSRSDPPISILAHSYIDYNASSRVIAQRPAVLEGRLLETNTNAPISSHHLYIISSDGFHTLTTHDDGYFDFDTIYPSGDHQVRIVWDGNLFINGSNVTYNLTAIPLQITPTSISALARGERISITGLVHAEDMIPDRGENVALYLDDQYLGTVNVDEDGLFTYSFILPDDETLRDVEIYYELVNSDTSASQSTIIGMRPDLNYLIREKGTWKDSLKIEVVLLTNRGVQMINEEIKLVSENQTTQTLYTDENGRAIFTVNFETRPRGDDYRFSLSHSGSEYIIPVTRTGVVELNGIINYQAILVGLICVGGVSGAVYYGYKRIKKRPPKKADTPVNRQEKQETPAEKPREVTGVFVIREENARIDVSIPEIRYTSLVWGVNQPLEMRIILRPMQKESATIKIEGLQNQDTINLDEDCEAVLKHTFTEKGITRIRLTYKGTQASAETLLVLNIIDYREEIIKLFNEDFNEHVTRAKELNYTATARELLVSSNQLEPHILEALVHLILCFEEATYSHHPITEDDYHRYMENRTNIEVDPAAD
jgi:transglutaminase-like putative cysteine protease